LLSLPVTRVPFPFFITTSSNVPYGSPLEGFDVYDMLLLITEEEADGLLDLRVAFVDLRVAFVDLRVADLVLLAGMLLY
jgi:hypothetical protein